MDKRYVSTPAGVHRMVYFATSNVRKIDSVCRVLGEYGIAIEQASVDILEVQADEAKAVAEAKVRAAYAFLRSPVMVIDSMLRIPSLGGFPGIFVKQATQQITADGYLRLLSCFTGQQSRRCTFTDVLAYMDGRNDPRFFTREEHGSIAFQERGKAHDGFKSALATVFVPEGQSKTLAEMTPEEFAAYRALPRMEQHYRTFADFLLNR